MILIGNESVAYSRFDPDTTHKLILLNRARPLSSHVSVTVSNIFIGDWFEIIRLKMSTHMLFVLCHQSNSPQFNSVTKAASDFYSVYFDARIDLPIEDVPPQLRSFADRSVVMLLYSNSAGIVSVPNLRPPPPQHSDIIGEFWKHYGDVQLKSAREICITSGFQRYIVLRGDNDQVHVLFAAEHSHDNNSIEKEYLGVKEGEEQDNDTRDGLSSCSEVIRMSYDIREKLRKYYNCQ
jgi:hypothetical protein